MGIRVYFYVNGEGYHVRARMSSSLLVQAVICVLVVRGRYIFAAVFAGTRTRSSFNKQSAIINQIRHHEEQIYFVILGH